MIGWMNKWMIESRFRDPDMESNFSHMSESEDTSYYDDLDEEIDDMLTDTQTNLPSDVNPDGAAAQMMSRAYQ